MNVMEKSEQEPSVLNSALRLSIKLKSIKFQLLLVFSVLFGTSFGTWHRRTERGLNQGKALLMFALKKFFLQFRDVTITSQMAVNEMVDNVNVNDWQLVKILTLLKTLEVVILLVKIFYFC